MTVPGIDPIICGAVVAAIGNGAGITRLAISVPGSIWCQDRNRTVDSGYRSEGEDAAPKDTAKK